MAQHFLLPFSFEFMFERASWRACSFSLVQEAEHGSSSEHLERLAQRGNLKVRLHGCDDYIVPTSPKHQLLHTWSTELVPGFQALRHLQLSNSQIPESLSELLVSFHSKPTAERKGDAWKMREEFFRLEETNSALLSFIRKWGNLGGGRLIPTSANFRNGSTHEGFDCVLPFIAWRWRTKLKQGMLARPDTWLRSEDADIGLPQQRSQFPYIGVVIRNGYRAMALSITLDHLRQVKSRVCARPDCDAIFTLASNHRRSYCSQYCAHIVSVRKGRAAKKEANSADKPGRA